MTARRLSLSLRIRQLTDEVSWANSSEHGAPPEMVDELRRLEKELGEMSKVEKLVDQVMNLTQEETAELIEECFALLPGDAQTSCLRKLMKDHSIDPEEFVEV